ncbi:hypothetical protein DFH06DRAFT_1138637 [Mycena polygramma]|nr:hypothetical protein DFH06DRAFT_1138637 [Mycena polygramma]
MSSLSAPLQYSPADAGAKILAFLGPIWPGNPPVTVTDPKILHFTTRRHPSPEGSVEMVQYSDFNPTFLSVAPLLSLSRSALSIGPQDLGINSSNDKHIELLADSHFLGAVTRLYKGEANAIRGVPEIATHPFAELTPEVSERKISMHRRKQTRPEVRVRAGDARRFTSVCQETQLEPAVAQLKIERQDRSGIESSKKPDSFTNGPEQISARPIFGRQATMKPALYYQLSIVIRIPKRTNREPRRVSQNCARIRCGCEAIYDTMTDETLQIKYGTNFGSACRLSSCMQKIQQILEVTVSSWHPKIYSVHEEAYPTRSFNPAHSGSQADRQDGKSRAPSKLSDVAGGLAARRPEG